MIKNFRVSCIILLATFILQGCAKSTETTSVTTGTGTTGTGTTTGTTPNLTISTLAGSNTAGSSDGTGAAAAFSNPWGVAADGQGNLFVADRDNNCIRKITSAGVVTTFAGSDTAGFINGTGIKARFSAPNLLAIDSYENIYVADQGNNCIRKITSGGVVSTYAGNGTAGLVNGTATAAEFNAPSGVAVDANGNLYVSDQSNHVIRKITLDGTVSTLAGSLQGFSNGTSTSAAFNSPSGIAVDAEGDVFVAEAGNHDIREITPDGTVSTVAGNGSLGYADATGVNAEFNVLAGLTLISDSILCVVDAGNQRIRKVTTAGVVTTVAGNGTKGFADGSGTSAEFNNPAGITFDNSGNIYIGDAGNNRIRKISAQ